MALATFLIGAPVAIAQVNGLASNFVAEPGERMLLATKIGAIPAFGVSGEQIGDVEDVVLGFDGSIVAVVIGVGGTLGLGEKPVAVRMEHLTLSRDEDGKMRVDVAMDRAALEDAPKFTPSEE